MRTFTILMALCAIIAVGCKSGEGSDIYIQEPIKRTTGQNDGHNARNSLDWAGVYEGISPCADCDGIKTTLRLNKDETFVLSQTYMGKSDGEVRYKQDGEFVWEDNGRDIIVKTQEHTIKFRIGERDVTMLDMEGNVVSGALANFYTLEKK